jgi:prepilin-type N-terminal cleavage/methylation domain-containing protein
MTISPPRYLTPGARGLTLIELLIVIAIIGILMALLFPSIARIKLMAEAAKNTANLREIGIATITWASDNGGKIPSPEYPGGMEPPPGVTEEEHFPEFWNLAESGLWLDGVVFGAVYMRENKEGERTTYPVDEEGSHLKGTLFESTVSVKKNPLEEDWHKHTYAMNANLKYDSIYDQVDSDDPYLTEKTMASLGFPTNAMLYIDCTEENVVRHEDRDLIIDTLEERWDGSKVIAFFLDGHAERLDENQIPEKDPESDRESSRFWRGVDAR